MGFIFLESDLNVLKALNKNWLQRIWFSAEEMKRMFSAAHILSASLACFLHGGILIFQCLKQTLKPESENPKSGLCAKVVKLMLRHICPADLCEESLGCWSLLLLIMLCS